MARQCLNSYTAAAATATTTTTVLWPFVWDYLASRYQKKHSPTHTYPDHQ